MPSEKSEAGILATGSSDEYIWSRRLLSVKKASSAGPVSGSVETRLSKNPRVTAQSHALLYETTRDSELSKQERRQGNPMAVKESVFHQGTGNVVLKNKT